MAKRIRVYTKYNYKQDNRVSHTGITKDPIRRQAEHQRADPGGHLKKVGNRVTKSGALNWERDQRRRGKPTEGYR